MAFQALIASRSERLLPTSLFGQLRSTCQQQIVVCWRSKVERRERLWAHLRSLPFAAITHLYGWLLPWAEEHDYLIADITRYTSSETEILRRQRLAVKRKHPQAQPALPSGQANQGWNEQRVRFGRFPALVVNLHKGCNG